MFGIKTKRIKQLEEENVLLFKDNVTLVSKCFEYIKDIARLRKKVEELQSKMQKLSPARDKNGRFKKK